MSGPVQFGEPTWGAPRRRPHIVSPAPPPLGDTDDGAEAPDGAVSVPDEAPATPSAADVLAARRAVREEADRG